MHVLFNVDEWFPMPTETNNMLSCPIPRLHLAKWQIPHWHLKGKKMGGWDGVWCHWPNIAMIIDQIWLHPYLISDVSHPSWPLCYIQLSARDCYIIVVTRPAAAGFLTTSWPVEAVIFSSSSNRAKYEVRCSANVQTPPILILHPPPISMLLVTT